MADPDKAKNFMTYDDAELKTYATVLHTGVGDFDIFGRIRSEECPIQADGKTPLAPWIAFIIVLVLCRF
jgi:hypothetical protein